MARGEVQEDGKKKALGKKSIELLWEKPVQPPFFWQLSELD